MLNSEEPTGLSTPQTRIRICDKNKIKRVAYEDPSEHNYNNSLQSQHPENLQQQIHHQNHNNITKTTTKKKLQFKTNPIETLEYLNSTQKHSTAGTFSGVRPGQLHVRMNLYK